MLVVNYAVFLISNLVPFKFIITIQFFMSFYSKQSVTFLYKIAQQNRLINKFENPKKPLVFPIFFY